jgi:hypothetical protein
VRRLADGGGGAGGPDLGRWVQTGCNLHAAHALLLVSSPVACSDPGSDPQLEVALGRRLWAWWWRSLSPPEEIGQAGCGVSSHLALQASSSDDTAGRNLWCSGSG